MQTTASAPVARRAPVFTFSIATPGDRPAIYRMRHDVYACELHQHPLREDRELRDGLDDFNEYILVHSPAELAGFVSITPPSRDRFSVDKYLSRGELPFDMRDGVYEVRLLTVSRVHRSTPLAAMLMYAAFRYVESRGGKRIVAIGRREVLSIYLKSGLKPLGRSIASGAVTFELLSATIEELRGALRPHAGSVQRLGQRIDWHLDISFASPAPCFHGGASMEIVGGDFSNLPSRDSIVPADVLDAPFDASPHAVAALRELVPWLAKTSPPADCGGMLQTIARVRGVVVANLIPGAGSSDLIFRALRHWLTPKSRVLLLDPTYGEYAHVLEHVIGCRVDRFTLERHRQYDIDVAHLSTVIVERNYDLVILANPNSPTGRHLARVDLEQLLRRTPRSTRVWIDETYVDYVGSDESLERFAAASENVVVCKSMSKVYALSGLRAAYLCGPAHLMESLRAITPPWIVSLPAQIAATYALQDPSYYAEQYRRVHDLRASLADDLRQQIGGDVIPGVANFLLVHLPESDPTSTEVVAACRQQLVYLRDASGMGMSIGKHAIRVAVRAGCENERIVDAMTIALNR